VQVVFDGIHYLPGGDRWVVAPEIFWKARGDHLGFTVCSIACVFKKLYGVTARR
jgi:hypothetical protein